jgi:hypothetical protein
MEKFPVVFVTFLGGIGVGVDRSGCVALFAPGLEAPEHQRMDRVARLKPCRCYGASFGGGAYGKVRTIWLRCCSQGPGLKPRMNEPLSEA